MALGSLRSDSPLINSACSFVLLLAACSPDSGKSKASTITAGNTGNRPAASTSTQPTSYAPPQAGGSLGLGIPDSGPSERVDARLSADSGCEGIADTRAEAPTMMLVIDRSASMTAGDDRWTPAVESVTNLTATRDDRVRFGLMTFPAGTDGCDTGELKVSPALHQSPAIGDALSINSPPAGRVSSGTPTAATLLAALQVLSSSSGERFVVLVTDGGPNCNAALETAGCTCTNSYPAICHGGPLFGPDGGPEVPAAPIQCLDDDATVAAVESLARAGIKTFVIGYDTSEWSSVLDRMASVGQTPYITHFDVGDSATMTQAFDTISQTVVSCTYALSAAPRDASYVSVEVDGIPIAIANANGNGWMLEGDRTVKFIGTACGRLRDGAAHDVVIVRECERQIQ